MKTNTPKLQTKHVTVTPKVAADMLSRNTQNRRLNPVIVNRYAKIMTEGGWRLNGETVKIDTNNEVKDGQHRLQAVIQSGISIEALVVYGVEPDVFDTIDTGKARTAADALHASGLAAMPNLVASIANLAIKDETGTMRIHQYVEPHRVRQWVGDHPEVTPAAEKARSMSILGFQPVLGLLYIKAKGEDAKLADAFFEQLKTGENLSKGDPALTLRETLIRHKADRSYHRGDVLSMGLKAWESYKAGHKLAVLKKPVHQRQPRTPRTVLTTNAPAAETKEGAYAA